MKKILWLMILAKAASASDYSGAFLNVNAGAGSFSELSAWAPAAALNAGYSFNRYLAAEAGYTIVSGAQIQNTVNVTSNIFDVAVKGTLPFNDTFSLYGRAGAGYLVNAWTGSILDKPNCDLCVDNNQSAIGLIGAGMSFSLTHNLDLHVEDTLFVPINNSSYTGNINTVMVGLQYNWGGKKSAVVASCPPSDDHPLQPVAITNIYIDNSTKSSAHRVVESDSNNFHCTYDKHTFHFKKDPDGREYLDVHLCDTLYWTAKKTGVSVEQLKRINHLKTDKIEIGSKLYIK